MKAIVRRNYVPPETLRLEEVDLPIPDTNEILVRVYATTVNRTDSGMLRAHPFIVRFFTGLLRPRRPITGSEFAGRVESIGIEVTKFLAGDDVFGFHDEGQSTHAEYLTISEDACVLHLPKNLSHQEAAPSSEGAHYAYNFICKTGIKSGQKILINGATGAIGSSLLQFAKYYGATVTAVCDTINIALIKSLGADQIFDYTKEDFTKDEEQKYDFIYDTVGNVSFRQCKRLLKPKGVFISSELGWRGANVFHALTTPFLGGKKVIFPIPVKINRSLKFIKERIEQGHFKPVIDRKYPLEEVPAAFNYVETGMKTGNVVIVVME